MKKVLVTTDFSAASKSAIRFAINWAAQQSLELVFTHVYSVMQPTGWSQSVLKKYEEKEINLVTEKLKNFIEEMYQQAGIRSRKWSVMVLSGVDAHVTLLYHTKKNPVYDCICISTRGAGKFKKFFGTNTGNLITKSEIPVLAIPKDYKTTTLTSVMYATDLNNYNEEIEKVVAFARPLKAKIDIVHFAWPNEILSEDELIATALKKRFKYGVEFHIEQTDPLHSLIQNLEQQIKKRKPSVVVMFTNQRRTFFQRMFLSSKSEELSFRTTVPLLVYNKHEKDAG